MPRSIKPRMSKDELEPFDKDIDGIYYEDGDACLVLNYDTSVIHLDVVDLQNLISFIKRNQL